MKSLVTVLALSSLPVLQLAKQIQDGDFAVRDDVGVWKASRDKHISFPCSKQQKKNLECAVVDPSGALKQQEWKALHNPKSNRQGQCEFEFSLPESKGNSIFAKLVIQCNKKSGKKKLESVPKYFFSLSVGSNHELLTFKMLPEQDMIQDGEKGEPDASAKTPGGQEDSSTQNGKGSDTTPNAEQSETGASATKSTTLTRGNAVTTKNPTLSPTLATRSPTQSPVTLTTSGPTGSATGSPTRGAATNSPTMSPTQANTKSPTGSKTNTKSPTGSPTKTNTRLPTSSPTVRTTKRPSDGDIESDSSESGSGRVTLAASAGVAVLLGFLLA